MPGVRDGAVVVAERADRGKHLVAFYSGARPLEADVLRDRLAESLPEYMVPSAFHWRERLPLTANGKIDRKTLTALAAELEAAEDDHDARRARPTEQRLAAAWATVLGVPADQIGRHDHFFDRGGTSLSAVKLAVALDRAVSLKDVIRHPVLADLAELIDAGQPQRCSAVPTRRQCRTAPTCTDRSLTTASKGHRDVVPIPGAPARRRPGARPAADAARRRPPATRPSWAAEHRDALRAVVAEHGAVLVRGLGLRDAGAGRRRLPAAGRPA